MLHVDYGSMSIYIMKPNCNITYAFQYISMAGSEVCTWVAQSSSWPRSLATIVNPGSYSGLMVDDVCLSVPRELSTKHSFFLMNHLEILDLV